MQVNRRIVIDAKGRERGIDTHRGDGPKPILATLAPGHHWAAGIVHEGVYPGTHNVSATADAAHVERSAVHKALEDLSGGGQWSSQDVSAHVEAIRRLGSAIPGYDRYVEAAKMLPAILPQNAAPLLRSSLPGSRAVGPRVDAMAAFVAPLVAAANQALAGAGRTTPLAQRRDRITPSRGMYEVVPPDEVGKDPDAPEQYPEPKKAIDAPIKPVKVGSVKKVVRDAAKREKTEQAGQGEVTLPEDPLPLISGDKRGNRFKDIAGLTGAGVSHAGVLDHLTRAYGLSRRQAQDTFRRWARAELVRRRKAGPDKLARPKTNVGMSHLEGRIGDPVERVGMHLAGNPDQYDAALAKAPKRPDDRVIHQQIAGTALAYHLRQIAMHDDPEIQHLAEKALAGEWHGVDEAGKGPKPVYDAPGGFPRSGKSGWEEPGKATVEKTPYDTFQRLGEHLARVKHAHAKTYDWKGVTDKLLMDHTVEQMMEHARRNRLKTYPLEDAPKDYAHDKTLWHDTMFLRANLNADFLHRIADGLRVAGTFRDKNGRRRTPTNQEILDSLHRIADRHTERAYLAEVKPTPKKLRGEIAGAMKLSRRDFDAHLVATHGEDGGEAHAMSLTDHAEEIGHPHLPIFREALAQYHDPVTQFSPDFHVRGGTRWHETGHEGENFGSHRVEVMHAHEDLPGAVTSSGDVDAERVPDPKPPFAVLTSLHGRHESSGPATGLNSHWTRVRIKSRAHLHALTSGMEPSAQRNLVQDAATLMNRHGVELPRTHES